VAPETDLTATDLTYGQLVRVPILGGEDRGVSSWWPWASPLKRIVSP
jgi:hypothetical protein